MTAPDWLVEEAAKSLHRARADLRGDDDADTCWACTEDAEMALRSLEPDDYAQAAIDTGGMQTLGTLHRDQDSYEGFRRAEP